MNIIDIQLRLTVINYHILLVNLDKKVLQNLKLTYHLLVVFVSPS